MQVESRPSGGAGDAPMAPPTNTQCSHKHLPATYSYDSAQTLGSPQSTHIDTDTALEMGGLSMAPRGPDTRHTTPRANVPPVTKGTMSTPDLATSVTCGMVATTTEILERFTWSPLVNEADHPLVDEAADAALREHFQRHLAVTPWSTSTGQAAPGQASAFDCLGHRAPAPQQEDQWAPRPEMTPRKVD